MSSRAPFLLLIAGPPCSGKSTVAERLCARWRWPLLAKDGIKDLVFRHLGGRDRHWSRQVSDLAWDVLFAQVAQFAASGVSVLFEGNFRREHAARLRALAVTTPVRFLQLQCEAEGELLWSRFTARAAAQSRHAGHADREAADYLRAELLAGRHVALDLPGTVLRYDTTRGDEPSFAALCERLDAELAQHT
jgi:predicted kinase